MPAVFPCGSHTSPGAHAGVPAILPTDIIQVYYISTLRIIHSVTFFVGPPWLHLVFLWVTNEARNNIVLHQKSSLHSEHEGILCSIMVSIFVGCNWGKKYKYRTASK